MAQEYVVVRGARQHNLKIRRLRIPKRKLVVFTGVSGSGKSSLAFDTLFAEGQRRYVESLSSYARQFLGQMDKPLYDKIEGLAPTIAIAQSRASSNPRSTVGTLTEVWDHMRVLWARVGDPHCPRCDRPIRPLSPQEVVAELKKADAQALLLAPLAENRKGEFRELLEDLRRRGFVRVRADGEVRPIAGVSPEPKRKHTLELVIDRLNPAQASEARLTDSVETALREGSGTVLLRFEDAARPPLRLSQHRACPACGIGLPELSPQSFSFNSPLGMCPACNGLGRRMEMDPDLVVPDDALSVRQGAMEPWAKIMGRGDGWSFRIVDALARDYGIDLDRPWRELPAKHRNLLLRGIGDRTVTVRYEGSRGSGTFRMPWEGVLNTLMRRFRSTRSAGMRDYYLRYFTDAQCADCGGLRLRPESMAVRVGGRSIVEVAGMPVKAAAAFFRDLALEGARARIAAEVLKEIRGRLRFLEDVGLDYLTLDRAGATLAGGEGQRIRLASQLGGDLSGVIYVLDEPSVGLHARDNARLLETLRRLKRGGNTVFVVEHDAETIRAADFVVDLGPGAGDRGGRVVFAGTPKGLVRSPGLTGRYLSGAERIEPPAGRRAAKGAVRVRGARENNLKGIDVAFPLGVLTAVTGVSGAGKSSLVTGILRPALARLLHGAQASPGAHSGIEGAEALDKVVHVDQGPIGRTPRSNPATFTGAFDVVRRILSELPESRMFGFKPGRFSFNVPGGRCEACEGAGVRRVEMHFLPDVWVPCEVCRGKRYNDATLRVRFKGLNVAELLDLSVERALDLFGAFPDLRRILRTLSDVGMEYVRLGQPAPTLSGGEAQRVKLSRELARTATGRTLYILDEPTTGLHFDDIRKLLAVLHRLVDAGNSVVVIEHNLDVVRSADWVIDLGPEGGEGGGRVVAEGTPERVAANPGSLTGQALRKGLRS